MASRSSRDDCISSLRKADEMTQGNLRQVDYEELDISPSSWTIKKVLGSWNEAKKMAGIQSVEHGKNDSFVETQEESPDWLNDGDGFSHYFRDKTDAVGGNYECMWVDGHEFRVHRLIAVAELGYEAVAGNDIHHVSQHGLDNRPSNLEAMTRSEHATTHGLGTDIGRGR